MRNKPRIRFKGFTEDWEQRKLGDIVDFLDGQRKPLKESDRIKGKYPYYGASGIIDYINDYLFDENLVLLSEDGANIIDRNYPVCFIATGKYWVNNHAHVLKAKAGVIDKFICESLERLDYTKFNTGTAQPKLNQDICQKIVITIPNEDEQKCISEFLNRINNIITLHQRKLEKLKLAKKALLQKLFPKNGSKFPELRFKGFADAWEQRKLGDLAEIVRGASPRPISDPKWFDNDSSVGWLRIADVTAQDGRIRYLEQKISELGQEKTRVIKTPHLLLSIAATVGKPVINYVPTGVHDGFLIFLNPKFNILYTFWWLEMFREKWNKYGQPGSQVNLNSDLVKNQVINIPNEKEQDKISSFLESLDKIITLHQ